MSKVLSQMQIPVLLPLYFTKSFEILLALAFIFIDINNGGKGFIAAAILRVKSKIENHCKPYSMNKIHEKGEKKVENFERQKSFLSSLNISLVIVSYKQRLTFIHTHMYSATSLRSIN